MCQRRCACAPTVTGCAVACAPTVTGCAVACVASSLAYHSPDVLWTLLGVFAVVAIVCGSYGAGRVLKRDCSRWCAVAMPVLSALTSGGVLVGVACLGGVVALLPPACLWLLAHVCCPLYVAYLYLWRDRREEKRRQEEERRRQYWQAQRRHQDDSDAMASRQRLLDSDLPATATHCHESGDSHGAGYQRQSVAVDTSAYTAPMESTTRMWDRGSERDRDYGSAGAQGAGVPMPKGVDTNGMWLFDGESPAMASSQGDVVDDQTGNSSTPSGNTGNASGNATVTDVAAHAEFTLFDDD